MHFLDTSLKIFDNSWKLILAPAARFPKSHCIAVISFGVIIFISSRELIKIISSRELIESHHFYIIERATWESSFLYHRESYLRVIIFISLRELLESHHFYIIERANQDIKNGYTLGADDETTPVPTSGESSFLQWYQQVHVLLMRQLRRPS